MNISKLKEEPKKQRYEIAIQSQPMTYLQNNGPFVDVSRQLAKSTAPDSFNRNSKFESTQMLVQKISFAEKSSKADIQRKKEMPKAKARRIINVNLMKLQDKHFQIDKNIYNIALGQLDSKEAYLSTLTEEINELRNKIQALEEEENEQQVNRSIDRQNVWSQKPSKDRSRTIDTRKTQCGRFYRKLATPQSAGKQIKFRGKQEESTFFKWQPQIQGGQITELALNSKEMAKQFNHKKNPEQQTRPNYRLKKTPKQSSLPFQKDDYSSLNAQQQNRGGSFVNTVVNTQKLISNEAPEWSSEGKRDPLPETEVAYDHDFKIFKQAEAECQIESIGDDFREKMRKKLQIPSGFPLQPLSPLLTNTEYTRLSVGLYDLFGVDLQKMKQKVIVRKFKNGVYYQLPPDKNIIWYFNGAFYLGSWETDLPTEGQKNGLGFQYIPNKYVYLGNFKNGLRHGKGVIHVFPKQSEKQLPFTGYDGDWFNGKPDGFGKHIDQNNTKYIGSFVGGEKTGKAIILTKDGLSYEGDVVKGIKHGLGLEKLVNGDTYTGEFSDGKFNGQGVYRWKNGSSYEGQFVKGKREGRGVWKSSNGDIFEGQYMGDTKHGWGQFKWANGQIYEGEFRNDIRHGTGTYKHPSGKQGKFLWKDGEIERRVSFLEAQQPGIVQKGQQQKAV